MGCRAERLLAPAVRVSKKEWHTPVSRVVNSQRIRRAFVDQTTARTSLHLPAAQLFLSRAMEPAGRSLANQDDLGDLFDSSLRLEEIQLSKGYEDGYKDGLESGKEEGRQVGLKHGFQVGEELGFYLGCVDLWESAIRIEPTAFSERVRKGVIQIMELLDRYPMMDPKDESLQEMMAALRSKFRVVTASMGVKVAYEGYLQDERGVDF